ncbi:hypothetical protein HAZT_HAZT008040, partial [Hyalella azteca]
MDVDGVIETNYHEVVTSFDDMDLRDDLLRGIYAYGFEKPSAIQQRAILPCIKGYDCIAQAQSGTGKTATFSISILQRIDPKSPNTQALILAPTRELAQQVSFPPVPSHSSSTLTFLQVYDMINRRVLDPNFIKMFVLDESDEMLSRGFKDQIYDIFRYLPSEVQVVLLSATMPQEVLEVTKKFMRDPKTILVKKEELTL